MTDRVTMIHDSIKRLSAEHAGLQSENQRLSAENQRLRRALERIHDYHVLTAQDYYEIYGACDDWPPFIARTALSEEVSQ